jgi:uncharacterized protein (DUF4415 family)
MKKKRKLIPPTAKESTAITKAARRDPENPVRSRAQIMRMRPAAEVLPDLIANYRRGRGPQKSPTKLAVKLRLDQDIIAAYRATGAGWQTRINADLRKVRRLGT